MDKIEQKPESDTYLPFGQLTKNQSLKPGIAKPVRKRGRSYTNEIVKFVSF